MTLAKEYTFWRFMPSKFRYTRRQRTTSNWRDFTSGHWRWNLLFLIRRL